MVQNYWENGVNSILKKVLNGKRTIQEAKFYMLEHYIYDGNVCSRKALDHVTYNEKRTLSDSIAESKAYDLICDAIKLGYGNDYNFERVYR